MAPKKAAKEPKAKKEKDPNAPKRALGAYMFFSKLKRDEIKAKNPSYGVTDIAKELGAAWKLLGEKEKSKYEDMAKKDKERYEKEVAKYKGK
ncbi:hypothetical protein Rsub_08196 [Raphidocelis subcapitata]|uniref:HMG box domain-containing protein n=1 Tax=Raphidocelis subcapitata TaxID=307507 RepID=A0A2V0PCZ6_9CHLO|nr:hypothetical protein Rsub_08196 [Raphidocelis subcapitata]|eukprot:GBF95760.1 hypothetical protein Rsub_08196 [Raphidocelis subcapitata]